MSKCNYKNCKQDVKIGQYCEKHHNVMSGITEIRYSKTNLGEAVEETASFWGFIKWLIGYDG